MQLSTARGTLTVLFDTPSFHFISPFHIFRVHIRVMCATYVCVFFSRGVPAAVSHLPTCINRCYLVVVCYRDRLSAAQQTSNGAAAVSHLPTHINRCYIRCAYHGRLSAARHDSIRYGNNDDDPAVGCWRWSAPPEASSSTTGSCLWACTQSGLTPTTSRRPSGSPGCRTESRR